MPNPFSYESSVRSISHISIYQNTWLSQFLLANFTRFKILLSFPRVPKTRKMLTKLNKGAWEEEKGGRRSSLPDKTSAVTSKPWKGSLVTGAFVSSLKSRKRCWQRRRRWRRAGREGQGWPARVPGVRLIQKLNRSPEFRRGLTTVTTGYNQKHNQSPLAWPRKASL